MRTVVPDYYDAFRCLEGACPHTCCAGWEVVIDEETARRYFMEQGALGQRLRAALKQDADGDWCFPLDGGRCPFLDGDGLCVIHRALGAEATSVTCREHPRFVEEYGPFREISLCASCPEACRLLLDKETPLEFRILETAEPEEAGDPWLKWLVPLRDRMLDLLRDRRSPLKRRLGALLDLAKTVQRCLDEEREEEIPAVAAAWRPCGGGGVSGPGLFPGALDFLAGLETMDPAWPALLAAAGQHPPVPESQPLLERVAVYFAFRYLLKAVNDGDLLGRARLCVLAVLTVERLAAVCGLEEALRRFSCEIEHSEENLEAILDGFRWEETLAPQRLWNELYAD